LKRSINLRARCKVWPDYLHRNSAAEFQVRGLVDNSHTTFAECFLNLIAIVKELSLPRAPVATDGRHDRVPRADLGMSHL
jgi:hypothetical protein